MNILVVEETPENPDSIFCGLTRLGYAIDSIPIEPVGKWISSSIRYDIIVLDLVAPAGPGLLALHELREAHPDAKILILSPACDIQQQITTLIQGADEILVKPFDLAGLVAVLRDNDQRQGPH